jgi:hypothetical protein
MEKIIALLDSIITELSNIDKEHPGDHSVLDLHLAQCKSLNQTLMNLLERINLTMPHGMQVGLVLAKLKRMFSTILPSL